MHFNILMFFDDRLSSIGSISSEVAREYAASHGHLFTLHRMSEPSRIAPCWEKLKLIASEMHRAEYTVWLDADALIVGSQDLGSLIGERCLYVSVDSHGICCGVMIIKSCAWAKKLIDSWMFLGRVSDSQAGVYDRRNLDDQTALKCLIANFPSVATQVGNLPERYVLNPRSEFVTDPLIMHYWSSSGHLAGIENCMRVYRERGWCRDAFYDWNQRSIPEE